MGTTQAILTAYGSLSNRNCNQDELDHTAWLEFAAKVCELAERPEYANLMIMVNFGPSN